MNFSCDACGRAYSVPDEKVQGRAFKVTCRQCGNLIRVPASRPAAAARPPPAPPPPPTPAPPPVQPHLTPPSTQVAGGAAAPRAGGHGMTDEEMAWLAGAPAQPRTSLVPAPPPPAPEPTSVDGTTSDVEAAEAAFAALEAAAREETAPAPAPAGPDALPPLPPPDEGEPAPASARGPGPLRIATAAVLVLLAGAIAAWQLGWLVGPPERAAPPPPPAPATPAPPQVPASAPAEDPGEAAAAAPAPAPELPAVAPAAAEPSAPPPAPAPARREAAAAPGDRAAKNLRIARKDRRLLDLLEKKGDAAPAAPVERDTLDTGLAELDQAAVERALAENRPAFAACITRALKADPSLDVEDRRATLMLTVRPNGTVARAWIAEADLESTPLGRCLVGASRRVVFPAFQGEALDVSAPLVLGAIR